MTAGESHGEALTAVLEGVPAGMRITSEDIRAALAQCRLGHGRGARQAPERGELRVLGGTRHGSTIGSPVALQIANSEWPKWSTVMSADLVIPHDLLIDAGTGDECEIVRNRLLTRPGPGHVDLPEMFKYDLPEARLVLERASAREITARVALGVVVEALLEQVAGIRLVSRVVRIGSVALPDDVPPPKAEDAGRLNADPVRCTDPVTSAAMAAEIDTIRKDGDTFGGAVEVIATGVPVGLGIHVSVDCRLDAQLAVALMGVQAVKGVRIGDGLAEAARRDSAVHDEIVSVDYGRFTRSTNRAGGIEGGTSNGSDVRVRAAFKSISTASGALRTVDLAMGEPVAGLHQRSDVCAVVPGVVIAQTMTTPVLVDLLLDKTGGDSVDEARCNPRSYSSHIAERAQWRTEW